MLLYSDALVSHYQKNAFFLIFAKLKCKVTLKPVIVIIIIIL